jgi:hypothetical protein
MTSTEAAQKPFQFGLQSLFVATAAVAAVLGLSNWLGLDAFFLLVILPFQFAMVIAILIMSRGTAWKGVVLFGLTAAIFALVLERIEVVFSWRGVVFLASFAAWYGGGLTASPQTIQQSVFLRRAPLLALAWFLILFAIGGLIMFVEWRTNGS